jgi:molybdopterin-containing oxidoreductase family membrane subunit
VLNSVVFVIVYTCNTGNCPLRGLEVICPTWQEWAVALAVIGYGFLLFSVSYRYLRFFSEKKGSLTPIRRVLNQVIKG